MMTNRMPNPLPSPRTEAAAFRLEMLDLLPCGCIVAIQRMAQSGVRVVSMEAKGPHCLFVEHHANKVIRLGDLPDSFEDYSEEAIRVA
jgi:hypothetical protein